MFYALTLDQTIITGVHESLLPFHAQTFETNPRLMNHEVLSIPDPADYLTGMDLRCYEPDGTQKPLVWCIEQGFLPLPPGKEIMGGVLVDTQTPEAQAPPSLLNALHDAQAAVAANDAVLSDLLLLLIDSGVIVSV